jgi:ribosomal protein S18 acetylase RimI-like enzyme
MAAFEATTPKEVGPLCLLRQPSSCFLLKNGILQLAAGSTNAMVAAAIEKYGVLLYIPARKECLDSLLGAGSPILRILSKPPAKAYKAPLLAHGAEVATTCDLLLSSDEWAALLPHDSELVKELYDVAFSHLKEIGGSEEAGPAAVLSHATWPSVVEAITSYFTARVDVPSNAPVTAAPAAVTARRTEPSLRFGWRGLTQRDDAARDAARQAFVEAFEHAYATIGIPFERAFLVQEFNKYMTKALEEPSIWYCDVYNCNGKICGMIFYACEVDKVYVAQLCVAPDYQNMCIGKTIMRHLLSKTKPGTAICGLTRVQNERAVKFYEDLIKEMGGDTVGCRREIADVIKEDAGWRKYIERYPPQFTAFHFIVAATKAA